MNMQKAKERARQIVGEMTVEEKISQLLYASPAIERLGIREYNWWNEASHGVARSGMATVFPHAIALASTFNPDLIETVGDAVSTEGRAKYNKSVEWGDRDIYKGLTYWTPNINIFRDPRWGRGQETFGEDPFL
ncbi:MAG: glycoside hydrolase family 3 protein, partial [Clostridia bacterium]|nr:glycoside hydrolase family 3 protein [Clostridia bacterium]